MINNSTQFRNQVERGGERTTGIDNSTQGRNQVERGGERTTGIDNSTQSRTKKREVEREPLG